MSIDLISAVWNRGPEQSSQRFVLLALADQASDAGYCWPSYANIAKRVCMARPTVIRIVKDLEQAGWLATKTRSRADGSRTSNGIAINLTRLGVVADDDHLVTEDDYPSNAPLPGVVTDDDRGGHLRLPDPSSDPSIRSVKEPGGSPAHVTVKEMRASSPRLSPPPVPEPQPRPRPEPRPAAAARPAPKVDPAVADLCNAISETTGVSARLRWDEVSAFARQLLDAGYTAEQLRTHYGREIRAGTWNWYREDWRGRDKGERPTIKNITETIAGATSHTPVRENKQETKTWDFTERLLQEMERNGVLQPARSSAAGS